MKKHITIVTTIMMLGLFLGALGMYRMKKEIQAVQAQSQFLSYELAKLYEKFRLREVPVQNMPHLSKEQTLGSFNYQWSHYNAGLGLASDTSFINEVEETISYYTNLPKEWFRGKKVLDLGAGSGRFTYGLLSLGAEVVALEQSEGGCHEIKKLCQEFKTNCQIINANILEEEIPKGFDLVFCYGVAHHTGNTYLAINKACEAVKPGGKLFLMVYGYPETTGDYRELNDYEALREEVRNLSYSETINFLEKRYPKELVHGYFDAISPRENDLMRFGELVDLLNNNGISDIQKTSRNRNHHVIGTKQHLVTISK